MQVTNAEYGHGLTMSAEEHYWDFAKLQGYLTDNQLAALDYVQREVLGFVKRVMRFTALGVKCSKLSALNIAPISASPLSDALLLR